MGKIAVGSQREKHPATEMILLPVFQILTTRIRTPDPVVLR